METAIEQVMIALGADRLQRGLRCFRIALLIQRREQSAFDLWCGRADEKADEKMRRREEEPPTEEEEEEEGGKSE